MAAESVQKDSNWVQSVRNFFRLAERVEDPAIIAPILAVIKHRPADLDGYAFRVLSRFEDPRLTEPALEALLAPRADSSRWRSDQLLTLARQLKEQTAARLVKELKESKDAARRANAAEALPRLIVNEYAPWGAIYRDRKNTGAADPREDAARKTSYDVAIDPLLSALDDPDAAVQEAAARALPAIRQSFNLKADDRPVRRLLAWLPKARSIPEETAEFLVWTRHEAVKPALLAAFRDRGRKDLALMTAFRQAGWSEAVPEVYASLKETVASGKSQTEAGVRLQVLEGLPPDGRAKLHDILRDKEMPLGLRVDAASELSGHSYPPLGHEYPQSLRRYAGPARRGAEGGDDDPRLKTIRLPHNATKDDLPTRRQSRRRVADPRGREARSRTRLSHAHEALPHARRRRVPPVRRLPPRTDAAASGEGEAVVASAVPRTYNEGEVPVQSPSVQWPCGEETMSVLVFDPSTIEKLKAVVVGAEVRDQQGTLVGYFHPVASPETVDQYECPMSEEDLLRLARNGGGRPLVDILKDLGHRS